MLAAILIGWATLSVVVALLLGRFMAEGMGSRGSDA